MGEQNTSWDAVWDLEEHVCDDCSFEGLLTVLGGQLGIDDVVLVLQFVAIFVGLGHVVWIHKVRIGDDVEFLMQGGMDKLKLRDGSSSDGIIEQIGLEVFGGVEVCWLDV